jgi:uncharacterized iron-regulated membrane protein
MRLWLKDSERRPDPTPVATDDRKPMIVGIIAWVIALGGVLLAGPVFGMSLPTLWLWTCVAGLVFGALGLLYTHRRHGR